MEYGIFITKEGKNVLQKQSINDYILNSNFNTLKIFRQIEGIIPVPLGGEGTVTVPHGLGYQPAFLAYYKLKPNDTTWPNSWWLDWTSLNSGIVSNDDYRSNGTLVTNSDITFKAEDGASQGARDIEFKAFLLTDSIDLVDKNLKGLVLSKKEGFKISKPNINVLQAKAHELLISSEYETLKYHTEFNSSITIPASSIAESKGPFRHGLGYVPIVVGMVHQYDDTTKQAYLPFGRVPQDIAMSLRIDKNEVWFNVVTSGIFGQIIISFKIIVFKNILEYV